MKKYQGSKLNSVDVSAVAVCTQCWSRMLVHRVLYLTPPLSLLVPMTSILKCCTTKSCKGCWGISVNLVAFCWSSRCRCCCFFSVEFFHVGILSHPLLHPWSHHYYLLLHSHAVRWMLPRILSIVFAPWNKMWPVLMPFGMLVLCICWSIWITASLDAVKWWSSGVPPYSRPWSQVVSPCLLIPQWCWKLGMGHCKSTSNPCSIGSRRRCSVTYWFQQWWLSLPRSVVTLVTSSNAVNRRLRSHSICCCGNQNPRLNVLMARLPARRRCFARPQPMSSTTTALSSS